MVKRSFQFRLLLCLAILLFSTVPVFSHPGGIDALGCHTCRTNCEEKYGIPYDFYHRHNPTRDCFDTLPNIPVSSISLNVDGVPENPPVPPVGSPPVAVSTPEQTPYAIPPVVRPGAPTPPTSSPQSSSRPSPQPTSSTILPSLLVTRVVDGDTFVLHSGEKVRLIGIDTAERGQCYYRQAKNELRDLILFREVQLERDISDMDRYGRLLRYVYLSGVFVNEELVKEGHAKAKRYKPDVKFSKQFADLESVAKGRKSGMWGKCPTVSAVAS